MHVSRAVTDFTDQSYFIFVYGIGSHQAMDYVMVGRRSEQAKSDQVVWYHWVVIPHYLLDTSLCLML